MSTLLVFAVARLAANPTIQMAKILPDIVHEPANYVEDNGLWKVGEKCWAAKGNGFVFSEIDKIRYDKSVNLSRYLVKTRICSFWSSFIHERFPVGGEAYGPDGYPYANDWE
jgi:hypothetical protein